MFNNGMKNYFAAGIMSTINFGKTVIWNLAFLSYIRLQMGYS